MYDTILASDARPRPFSTYTAQELWDDDHISQQMLAYHLDGDLEPASRRTEQIAATLEWICTTFQVGPGTRIADFGCGPGLYSLPLAQRGSAVTGIDFSRRSLGHARRCAAEQGLEIDYVLGNYLDYRSAKQFDLITLIYCDYCALSPEQRTRLLSIFHHHLAPGGRLLLDVCSLQAFAQRQEVRTFERRLMDGFWAAGDYLGLQRTFVYEEEQVVLDKYTIVEPGGVRVIYNWLQYFSPATIEHELTESGFSVKGLYANCWGEAYAVDSPEIAVVASKR